MKSNIIKFPIQSPYQRNVSGRLQALASGLMFSCHIQPDRSLVAVLGYGHEYSNHEALTSWLLTQYGEDAIDQLNNPLEQLTEKLYRFLFDHLDNQEVNQWYT